jgi:hypothetical protein
MFEEQRSWLKKFHRSEVKAAPTTAPAAPVTKQLAPAHGAQWAGNIPAPAETGLPAGWTPIDLPANFEDVFGYQEPLQRKEIAPVEYKHSDEDLFDQVRDEATRSATRDKFHDPEFEHTASQQFIAEMKALREYKESAFPRYTDVQPAQAKATLTTINLDGVTLLVYGGGMWTLSGNGGMNFVTGSIAMVDAWIAALQAMKAAGGKAMPKYLAQRYDAERRYQAAIDAGKIELTGKKDVSRTLTDAEWREKLGIK